MDWHAQKKKTGRINICENGAGKKIVGHCKLKLWAFFWGQSKHNDSCTIMNTGDCISPDTVGLFPWEPC